MILRRRAALFCGTVFAVTALLAASDPQLNHEDASLDAQIKEAISRIEKLHTLRELKSLHLAPQQTRIKLSGSGECLEVDSHADTLEVPRAKSAPVDYKTETIHICFSGNKLTRIESAFTTVSRLKQEKVANSFVHRNPGEATPNEIEITTAFNDRQKSPLRVGDLENTAINPLRLSFKRDYYLPHLKNTAYILQLTYDWHRREAIKLNEKTVQQYINRSE